MLQKIFQFHKGTIKPRGRGALVVPFLAFNSIKVQLSLFLLPRVNLYTIFQFHKGTIKPNISSNGTVVDVELSIP